MKTFQRRVRGESDRKPQFPDDLIDDLTQSVYLKLVEEECRAIRRFEGEHDNSIFLYLSMMSVNVVRDHFREQKALKRPKVSYSLDELIESGGDAVLSGAAVSHLDGTPASIPIPAFTREELDRALERAVSGRHRDRDILIFKLRYYDGLMLHEITTTLGLDLSPISVSTILKRISLRLRPLLKQCERNR